MDSKSLVSDLNENTLLQIANLYSFTTVSSTLKVQCLSVQQQRGVVDCGLFSVAMAVEVCFDKKPEAASFNQGLMRSHLLNCLQEKRIQVFPKMRQKESLPRPPRRNYMITLYCLCRMPEELDEVMILCDSCESWYHCSCVSIDPENIPDSWICASC